MKFSTFITGLIVLVVLFVSGIITATHFHDKKEAEERANAVYVMPTDEYIILQHNYLSEMTNEVNYLMQHGYETNGPLGFVSANGHSWDIYTQSMKKVHTK